MISPSHMAKACGISGVRCAIPILPCWFMQMSPVWAENVFWILSSVSSAAACGVWPESMRLQAWCAPKILITNSPVPVEETAP